MKYLILFCNFLIYKWESHFSWYGTVLSLHNQGYWIEAKWLTFDPLSLKMISTSKIGPNCCWTRMKENEIQNEKMNLLSPSCTFWTDFLYHLISQLFYDAHGAMGWTF